MKRALVVYIMILSFVLSSPVYAGVGGVAKSIVKAPYTIVKKTAKVFLVLGGLAVVVLLKAGSKQQTRTFYHEYGRIVYVDEDKYSATEQKQMNENADKLMEDLKKIK